MSDIVLTVKGVVLNTQRPVKLHMGSVNYYAGDNTYTSQIDLVQLMALRFGTFPLLATLRKHFYIKLSPRQKNSFRMTILESFT